MFRKALAALDSGADMMLCEGLDGKETHGLMCDMLSKEGEARRLRLNAMPYSDEPQPRGLLVVVQDITERVLPELQTLHPAEAEAAVKEMQMLIDDAFVPIWGADRDWKITVWSPKAEIAILPRGITKAAEVLVVANLNGGLHQSATSESQGEVEEPS